MQIRTITLLASLLGFQMLTGCASTEATLSDQELDATRQITYVKDGNELFLIDGRGSGPQKLMGLEAAIASPIWSPDGKNIALYSFDKQISPFNILTKLISDAKKMALVVVDADDREYKTLGSFSVRAIHYVPNEEGSWIIPPSWSSDGKSLFVTDDEGIHRVAVNGERMQVVQKKKLRETAISPVGVQVAYTDGEELFLDKADGEIQLNLTEKLPTFGWPPNKNIRKLAFSPDDSQLAVGDRNRLIVVSLDSMKVTATHKASDYVSWIGWLPSAARLIFLTGLPTIKLSPGTVPGRYTLFTISTNGNDLAKIYEKQNINVRIACPSLSSDGRFVTLIANSLRSNAKVFVVSTDGSGYRQLTFDGQCSSPSWRPDASL